MAIDTELRRRSAAAYTFVGVLPLKNGSVSAPDRAMVAGFYAGITYASPAASVVPTIRLNKFFSFLRRR